MQRPARPATAAIAELDVLASRRRRGPLDTGVLSARPRRRWRPNSFPFGAASAEPLLGGDFDGDGAPDAIFVDKSNYTWHVRFSKDDTAHSFSFGDGGDVPVH